MLSSGLRIHDFIGNLALLAGNDHVLNDRELSALLGRERSYIAQLRKGRALPSDDIFLKILRLLKMSDADIDQAFAMLAAARLAEQSDARKVWERIATKVAATAASLLVVVLLMPVPSAQAAPALETRAGHSVYYGKWRRFLSSMWRLLHFTLPRLRLAT